MRRKRILDLKIYTRWLITTTVMQNNSYWHPCIKLEINSINHELRVHSVRIESISETKGVMTIDFCEDGHNTGFVLQNLNGVKKQYLCSLRDILKEVNPLGQVGASWKVLPNHTVSNVQTIREVTFQLKVIFAPQLKDRETFPEAALRVYGEYLDCFKIPREDAGGLSFSFKQFVFVRPTGEKRRIKILVEDYLKQLNKFE